MQPAVVLARVSSAEQEEGHSLDAQLANLQDYAKRKGLDVIETFRIIESSTKGHRPEFERMIEFIAQQRQRTALIVDCVDRLQRSFIHTPILNGLIVKDLLEIHFVREGNVLDRDATSNQKLMWNLGVLMAQSYTDQLTDNVKRSIKHKLEKGECISKAPLGYLNVPDKETGKNTVILDHDRSFLVKRLFTEYATSIISLGELQQMAKDWGLRTHQGNAVSVQTIFNTLHNPFYYGMQRIKEKLYPHKYPQLIDKDLFEACQKPKSQTRQQAIRQTKEAFVLRGLITCSASGRKVGCDRKKGQYTYLIARDPADPKQKIWVKEETILNQVRTVLQSIAIPDDMLAEMLGYLRQTHEAEKTFHHDRIRALQLESNDLTGKLDRLTDLMLEESITKDIYTKKHQKILQRQHEISRLLADSHEADGQFKIALSVLISLAAKAADLFDGSEIDEKRQLVGFVFANLQLDGASLRYTLKKPFDLLVNLAGHQDWRAMRDESVYQSVRV